MEDAKNNSTAVTTVPFSTKQGCGDFLVFAENDEHLSFSFYTNIFELDLEDLPMTFELPKADFNITLLQFDGPIGNYHCDDVLGDEGNILSSNSPIAGAVRIFPPVGEMTEEPCFNNYTISLLFTDLIFEIDGEEKYIEELSFEDVIVGWCPG